MIPDVDRSELDTWVPAPTLRIAHSVESQAPPAHVWRAAQTLRVRDARLLGRLVRWRIPGTPPDASFHDLFRSPPFIVLAQGEHSLLSGIAGWIWTLRRDYPRLEDPETFRAWRRAGTVRVLFANWVEPRPPEGSVLRSETRAEAFGVHGRLGLASVRPLIRSAQHLIASDAMAAAVRMAAQNSRG